MKQITKTITLVLLLLAATTWQNIHAQVVSTFFDGNNVASFNTPNGVAVDASGNVYVADRDNNKIRKISEGVVSTLAGSRIQGSSDGVGAAASFFRPSGVAVDASGNVYVADSYNHNIRKISPAGVVSTLAGSGTQGITDGTGTAASFFRPSGVAVDGSGNVYVADAVNCKIRKISPAGAVSTLAGSGAAGSIDGTGTAASFKQPYGVAVDAFGNVYVADSRNNKIRKISPSGVVSTLAGSGFNVSADGAGTAASFEGPSGVAVDSTGNVYVTDFYGKKIRKISPSGVVSTLAGGGDGIGTDGVGTAASFEGPVGVALDASGNLYVADAGSNKIRKITISGTVTSVSDIIIASHTELANIYPNPSNEVVHIELSNPSSSYSIRVSNCTGSTVYSSPITTASHQLNTRNLGAKGLYFVQILDNNKVVETKKLVVE